MFRRPRGLSRVSYPGDRRTRLNPCRPRRLDSFAADYSPTYFDVRFIRPEFAFLVILDNCPMTLPQLNIFFFFFVYFVSLSHGQSDTEPPGKPYAIWWSRVRPALPAPSGRRATACPRFLITLLHLRCDLDPRCFFVDSITRSVACSTSTLPFISRSS